jgi:hypothetical protein
MYSKEYLESIKNKLDSLNKAAGNFPNKKELLDPNLPEDDGFFMISHGAKQYLEKNGKWNPPVYEDPIDNIKSYNPAEETIKRFQFPNKK